jgi:hypothetical protein
MKLFKVVNRRLRSKNGGSFLWTAPKFRGGKWVRSPKTPKLTGVVVCHKGYHLTLRPRRWYNDTDIPFLAAGFGKKQGDGDKKAFQQAQLIRPISPGEWRSLISKDSTPSKKLIAFWMKDPKMRKTWQTVQKTIEAEALRVKLSRQAAERSYRLGQLKANHLSGLGYAVANAKTAGIDVKEVNKALDALKDAITAVK